jgi:hypothetical protein
MNIGDEFLLTCKRNFFEKITPANEESKKKKDILNSLKSQSNISFKLIMNYSLDFSNNGSISLAFGLLI